MGGGSGIKRLAAGSTALALMVAATPPLQAQMSPNCERNCRRTACAYTPWPASSTTEREAGRIVFADHSIVEVQLEQASCREQGPLRSCRAWMQSPAGSGPLLPARYSGSGLEGAYRHSYSSSRLRLVYWVLD